MEGTKPPFLHKEVAYIWNVYCEMLKGCERVTWSEIEAYQSLAGIELTPWESSLMIELDIMRRTNA